MAGRPSPTSTEGGGGGEGGMCVCFSSFQSLRSTVCCAKKEGASVQKTKQGGGEGLQQPALRASSLSLLKGAEALCALQPVLCRVAGALLLNYMDAEGQPAPGSSVGL
jgi:hypothetical protein